MSTTEPVAAAMAALNTVLDGMPRLAVALSGGVDSMTLAAAAQARLGERVRMFHAVSPAVPAEATARVREHAGARGWRLEVLDAGEFADPRYRANPGDRCFFCKSNLYGSLRRLTDWPIAAGTNLDDLGDWRPGLRAAADHAVRHPFVEAGIDKATIRRLARRLGVGDVAELPAAPCLSSRIETGIPVEAADLALVHRLERCLGRTFAGATLRARIFRRGVVLQLEADALAAVEAGWHDGLKREIAAICAEAGRPGPVAWEPYRMGSAFHRPAS